MAFFYAHFQKGAGGMKLNEDEKRMAYQIESTNQAAALNEIYMTWRLAQNQKTKDTAESLYEAVPYRGRIRESPGEPGQGPYQDQEPCKGAFRQPPL